MHRRLVGWWWCAESEVGVSIRFTPSFCQKPTRLRVLSYFRDQPLLHPDLTDEILLVWYFEDWLKKYFFSVLQILEVKPLPCTYLSVFH